MRDSDYNLSDSEKVARLRLARTDGIGPITYQHLMRQYGNGAAALEGAMELAAKGGAKKPLRVPDASACADELAALEKLGGTALFHGMPTYPTLLAETDGAPPVVAVLGDVTHLHRQAIGVVGARNASAGGIKLTHKIAAELAGAGLTIVSGLARGIDTAAHKAALSHSTVACVAGGVDSIYPPENKTLYEAIRADGAIISEMPLGTEPQARHFPRRNRLISGLARAVLVVEAAVRSGSLITARFAAEQGRDVFAVPGSPLDPRAHGTNQLIRDGATLTQCAADILQDLDSLPLMRAPVQRATDHGAALPVAPVKAQGLLTMLTAAPIHIDEIVRLSGLSADAVNSAFLEYELAGKIERHPGGRISRIL